MSTRAALVLAAILFTPAAALAQSDDGWLDPGFHGSIVYTGNFSQSAGGGYGAARQTGGPVEIDLEFDGDRITGSYHGSVMVGRGQLSGTRDSGHCRLTSDLDGSVWEGSCDTHGFTGTVLPAAGARQNFQASFQTSQQGITDFAERDRQAQLAAADADSNMTEVATSDSMASDSDSMAADAAPAPAPAPVAKHAKLVTDASGNPVLTTAATGLSLDGLLDLLLKMDSQSWMMNRYDAGSASGSRYLVSNKSHTTFTAQANYTYSNMIGGGQGWMKVKIEGGHLVCLEFWDQAGNCRQPWQSLSQQNFVGFVGAMMSSGGGGGGSGGSNSGGETEIVLDRQDGNSTPAPQPAPVEPVGGDHGLYGSDHSCCRLP